jgi:hypothetical protein
MYTSLSYDETYQIVADKLQARITAELQKSVDSSWRQALQCIYFSTVIDMDEKQLRGLLYILTDAANVKNLLRLKTVLARLMATYPKFFRDFRKQFIKVAVASSKDIPKRVWIRAIEQQPLIMGILLWSPSPGALYKSP